MNSKVLIIDKQSRPLHKIRRFFSRKKFEIIRPTETESVFNICKTQKPSVVVVDTEVFGKRSRQFLQNLKDHILPPHVKLISVSKADRETYLSSLAGL